MNVFQICAALLTVCTRTVFGQWQGDSVIPPDYLRDDLSELEQVLMDSHPDPYRYCSPEAWQSAMGRALTAADSGLSPVEWLRTVAMLLSTIKDSHTAVDMRSFYGPFSKKGRALGFSVIGLHDGMYVRRDPLGMLAPGSRILSINGRNGLEIARDVSEFAFTEGLSSEGLARVRDSFFPQVFALLNDPLPDFVPVQIKPPGDSAAARTIYYPAKPIRTLRKIQQRAYRGDSGLPLSLTYRSDSVAVMRIGSFSAHTEGVYMRFLKRSFSELEMRPTVNRLVLDMRDNPGGSSGRMRKLFAYIYPEQLLVPQLVALKQSDLVWDSTARKYRGLRKRRIDKWARSDEDAGFYQKLCTMAIGDADTFFYKVPLAPATNVFTRSKTLLINGLTGSAAVSFAAVFRHYAMGNIEGESCMGPMSGTRGNATAWVMPNTGMRIFISTVFYAPLPSTPVPDPMPIRPDRSLNYTPDLLLRGIDPAWE